MDGGWGDSAIQSEPSSGKNDGEFLLHLLRSRPDTRIQFADPQAELSEISGKIPSIARSVHSLVDDPAIAAVGRSIPVQSDSACGVDFPPLSFRSASPPSQFGLISHVQTPPRAVNPCNNGFGALSFAHSDSNSGDVKLGFLSGGNSVDRGRKLMFGSFTFEIQNGCNSVHGAQKNGMLKIDVLDADNVIQNVTGLSRGSRFQSPTDREPSEDFITDQPGPPCGSITALRDGFEGEDLGERLINTLVLEDGLNKGTDKKEHQKSHEKDVRMVGRGRRMLSQRQRFIRRRMTCRIDINHLNSHFIAIYHSLIPAEEEKAKQKELLEHLEKLICGEWPKARLYIYGSCANSFGVSKSDIDICLAIEDVETRKTEMLLKLAEILQKGNLQNVQALTRARVPIVKLMDAVTAISCDICINNMLAVVNSKLLRDYAKIDVRVRQLAFIVKHWAKSRAVNETYQGTLSSYAYVLMCIHFLQQRIPKILPCLQTMKTTYSVTVEGVECAYFDQVDHLHNYGSSNQETIAHLVWEFFSYWAYGHDYTNDVISVRTGAIISKGDKDWTRRVGNDRHLICIEDPFETSHDLGRVVDKFTIKVLRGEFERAAEIMQFDPDPWVTLFEPYVPVLY